MAFMGFGAEADAAFLACFIAFMVLAMVKIADLHHTKTCDNNELDFTSC